MPPKEKKLTVVTSGEALSVVQGWLAGAGSEEERSESPAPELELRPARLGLGAKFLSHNKAMQNAAPVERRLESKLKVYKTKGAGGAAGTSSFGRKGNAQPNLVKGGDGDGSESEDEEDLGKGSRFSKRQVYNTQDMLKEAPAKKKKKKS